MRYVLVLGALVICALAVFFILERPDWGNHRGDSSADHELVASLKKANITEAELEREVQMLRSLSDGTGEERVPSEAPDVAKLIAAPEDSMERDYDLAALEAQFIEALQEPDKETRRASLELIAAFLAGLDNETAARFMGGILQTRDKATDGDAYFFASTFLDELSRTDPEAAVEWARSLPERLKYPAFQIVAKNWLPQNPGALTTWMEAIPDDGLRASLIRTVSHTLSTSDEAGFGQLWAQRLASQANDGSRLSDVVATHWGKANFQAALDWTLGLEDPDDREMGLLALTKVRAQSNPQEAAAWAQEALSGDVRVKAIQSAVTAWTAKDPVAVAAWLDSVADPQIADAVFDTVAISWMKKDEARARQWMAAVKVEQRRKDYIEIVSQR